MGTPLTGLLDVSTLAPVRGFPGAYLLGWVEESWHALCDDVERFHSWRPTLTSAGDAYRSLERQRSVFLARYERRAFGAGPFGDVRYWNGVRYVRVRGAAAAVPGTSNHGRGDTVDVRDPRAGRSLAYGTDAFDDFAKVAARHGWSNAEGRSVGEAWHWRKVAVGVAPVPPRPLEPQPTTPSREDPDMPTLVQSPKYATGLLDGGRLIGIGDQVTVEAWRRRVGDPVPVSDEDFMRMVRTSSSTWVLYCPPDLGGRGYAVWQGERAVGLGSKELVDEFLAKGATLLDRVSAADFDRFTA